MSTLTVERLDMNKLRIVGRLTTDTAPMLYDALFTWKNVDCKGDVYLDCSDLQYLASAGLRVLLKRRKELSPDYTVIISNPSDVVQKILEVTGFSEMLTICYD